MTEEMKGSNELVEWFHGTETGTLLVVSEEGYEVVKSQLVSLLSHSQAESRLSSSAFTAPEAVVPYKCLYMMLLNELLMYGQINLTGFYNSFVRAHSHMSIFFGDEVQRLAILLKLE